MSLSSDANPALPAIPSFADWQAGVSASIRGRDEYKKARNELKLTAAAKTLQEGLDVWLTSQQQGFDTASPVWKDIQNAVQFAREICPDPWRGAFITWALNDDWLASHIATFRAHSEQFSYHRFIGDMCEAFGQKLSSGEHAVTSPFFNAATPDAVQYKTRLSDGRWQNISEQELLALSRDPNGPHIVHCANHAFLEDQGTDLDALQGEFSKLFDGAQTKFQKESSRNKDPERAKPAVQGHLSTWDKQPLTANDTITVFATHTRQNRFLNLAQLFRRLDEIDRAHDNPQADRFEHVAPVAAATVEFLLRSMVTEKDAARIHFGRDANGKLTLEGGPITLRPEALDILRRQRYRGFSKAGNDFRDSMRLLVNTLEAKDAQGNALVKAPEGMKTADITGAISMIVFGLNEKPMAEFYRKHGVHVPIVSSKNDMTAPPPSFAHTPDEPVLNYVGANKGDGHSPIYSVDGMLANPRVHDLLRVAGASSQAQVAIADIHLTNDAHALTLQLAPGATDAMMEALAPELIATLKKAKLGDISLRRVGEGASRYQLVSARPVLDSEIITTLRDTMLHLDVESAAPIVFSLAAQEKLSAIAREITLAAREGQPLTAIDAASIDERITDRIRYGNASYQPRKPNEEAATLPDRIARNAGAASDAWLNRTMTANALGGESALKKLEAELAAAQAAVDKRGAAR